MKSVPASLPSAVIGVPGSAAPLIETLGLPTENGRLKVDANLQVPGHPRVFAAGDAAAVPDLTQPGTITPPTAQHAIRQGKTLARNVAASLGYWSAKPYLAEGEPQRLMLRIRGGVMSLDGALTTRAQTRPRRPS